MSVALRTLVFFRRRKTDKQIDAQIRKLEREQGKLNTALYALYKMRDHSKAVEMRSLIGTCYKYKNTYGYEGDDKPIKFFWLYISVTGVTQDGSWVVEEFQIDSYGKMEFNVNVMRDNSTFESNHYIKISSHEYEEQKQNILRNMKLIKE